MLVTVEGETGGLVLDEFGEVEREEDSVVGNAEDEAGMDDCKVKDGVL